MQSSIEIEGLSKLHRVSKETSGSKPVNSRPNSSRNYKYHNSASLDSKITSKSDFYFKHLSEFELQTIVKRVRKANQKKRDEEEWNNFLRSRQEKNPETVLQTSCELGSSRESCPECGLLEVGSSRSKYSQLQEEENMGGAKDVGSDGLHSKLGTTITDNDTAHVYQLGPGLIKRLQDLLATVSKMTCLLLNPGIHSQFEDEDVDRAIKRSLEFDALFARNHLYEIQRQLKDIKQLTATKSTNTAELESKISAALKSVTAALQVYTRHVSRGAQVKYQQVVPIFQNISTLEKQLEHLTGQRLFPMRQELEVACSYMKQILLEINSTETKTVSTVSHKTVRPRNKQKPSADLSMYSRRQKAEWRRKTASLARARFGPPNTKKQSKKTVPGAAKENVDEKHKNCLVEGDKAEQNVSSRMCDKSQVVQQSKEPTNTKEVPFRNATRAVSEDHVSTMMEKIPIEPVDDCELWLDDSSFQVMKLLNNGVHMPLREDKVNDMQSQENIVLDSIRKINSDDLPPLPSSPQYSVPDQSAENPPSKSQSGAEEVSRPASGKSTAREARNVQLVCLKEGDTKSILPSDQGLNTVVADIDAVIDEDERLTLTIEEADRAEALEYHQKVVDYQKSNRHYKDDKAVGIVDRLANHILTDMIREFQQEEMDQVVRILYNLEFE